MTQRFEKAYNALIKAFFGGTLAKGNCSACAVGNIIADAQGAKVILNVSRADAFCEDGKNNYFWSNVFCSVRQYDNQFISFDIDSSDESRRILDLTGYHAREMAKIETAFETNTKIYIEEYMDSSEQEILQDQFNGLMAVMDVLLSFETEIDTTKEYKNSFKKHPKLINNV